MFGYTPYCSSKHALVGLTGRSVLSSCHREYGCATGLPCRIRFAHGRRARHIPHAGEPRAGPDHSQVVLDTIVKDTLAGIRAERFLIVPGTAARVAAFGLRHFPGISGRTGTERCGRFIGARLSKSRRSVLSGQSDGQPLQASAEEPRPGQAVRGGMTRPPRTARCLQFQRPNQAGSE